MPRRKIDEYDPRTHRAITPAALAAEKLRFKNRIYDEDQHELVSRSRVMYDTLLGDRLRDRKWNKYVKASENLIQKVQEWLIAVYNDEQVKNHDGYDKIVPAVQKLTWEELEAMCSGSMEPESFWLTIQTKNRKVHAAARAVKTAFNKFIPEWTKVKGLLPNKNASATIDKLLDDVVEPIRHTFDAAPTKTETGAPAPIAEAQPTPAESETPESTPAAVVPVPVVQPTEIEHSTNGRKNNQESSLLAGNAPEDDSETDERTPEQKAGGEKARESAKKINARRTADAEFNWKHFSRKWLVQAGIVTALSIALGGLPLVSYIMSLGVMPLLSPYIHRFVSGLFARGTTSTDRVIATMVVSLVTSLILGDITHTFLNTHVPETYQSLQDGLANFWDKATFGTLGIAHTGSPHIAPMEILNNPHFQPGHEFNFNHQTYHIDTAGNLHQVPYDPNAYDAPVKDVLAYYELHPHAADTINSPLPNETDNTPAPAPAEAAPAPATTPDTAPATTPVTHDVTPPQEAPGIQHAPATEAVGAAPETGVHDFDVIHNPPAADVMREFNPENMREVGFSEEQIETWTKFYTYLHEHYSADNPPTGRLSDIFGPNSPLS